MVPCTTLSISVQCQIQLLPDSFQERERLELHGKCMKLLAACCQAILRAVLGAWCRAWWQAAAQIDARKDAHDAPHRMSMFLTGRLVPVKTWNRLRVYRAELNTIGELKGGREEIRRFLKDFVVVSGGYEAWVSICSGTCFYPDSIVKGFLAAHRCRCSVVLQMFWNMLTPFLKIYMTKNSSD